MRHGFLYLRMKITSATFFFSLLLITSSCSKKIIQSSLFNGTDLSGWYAYVKDEKHENAAEIFQASNGMIRLNGEKPGYLMSTHSYANFELKLEYKWNTEPAFQRGIGTKNSGVMYNVPATTADQLWPAGIQFQIKEGATGDFVLLGDVTLTVRGERKAPGKSVVVNRSTENEKPVGEWNEIVIKSDKGVCSQYLNGKLVNEGTESSSAGGRILLQYEGSPIDFRKIVIKKLQ